MLHLPVLASFISTCTTSPSASFAANKENTVASCFVPFLRALTVRAWSVKLPLSVFINSYSPSPLKVYGNPSRVLMCGSPKNQAVKIIKVEELLFAINYHFHFLWLNNTACSVWINASWKIEKTDSFFKPFIKILFFKIICRKIQFKKIILKYSIFWHQIRFQ